MDGQVQSITAANAFPIEAVERTLPERFEQQTALYPGNLAVKAGLRSLTYAALDRAANNIAHAILHHIGPALQPVGMLLDPGPETVAAILGIWKAGKIWVPLDPALPQARLNFLLSGTSDAVSADAEPAALIASAPRVALVIHAAATRLLAEELDGPASRLDLDGLLLDAPAGVPPRAIGPNSLAFILYTSGSTGQPKGVVQNHGNILQAIRMHTLSLALGPVDRLVLLTTYSHLTGCTATLRALLNGGAVLPYALKTEGLAHFTDWMQAEAITIYQSVPTLFRHWGESLRDGVQFPHLRLVHLGGEPVSRADVALFQKHFGAHTRLLNNLGSTEAYSVRQFFMDSSSALEGSLVPVGYAVEGKEVLLMDEAGQPAGFDAAGEIVVKSRYLSPGYWGRPDLTEAVFAPGVGEPGVRLFRTGDLGLMRPDGRLFHLGRKDAQVKVRGARIETAEVEMALLEHPNIREAAVICVTARRGNALAACVSPRQAPPPGFAELRAFLQSRLPEVMIPTAFVCLPGLPRLANGKVDRKALAAELGSQDHPGGENHRAPPRADGLPITVEDTPPSSAAEIVLAGLWRKAFGLPAIGRHDNFFELGGHSLLALSLFGEIESVLGHKLPISLLVQHPTIAQLAGLLAEASGPVDWSCLVPIKPDGGRPPFFCVHDVGGNILNFAALAENMGDDQPFYALEGQGFDGRRPPLGTVEDMAAAYLRSVRQTQPRGPYYLGGYCFGGVVAYEMARRLRAEGETVGLLAIFEGYAPVRSAVGESRLAPGRLHFYWRNLPGWIADHRALGWDYTSRRVRHVVSQWVKQAGIRLGLRGPLRPADIVAGAENMHDHRRRVLQAHLAASRQYQPRPYPGLVTLLNIRRQSMLRDPDPRRGWQRLAQGGVEIKIIAGSHHNILEVPYVQSLAGALRASLEQAQAGPKLNEGDEK